MRFMVEVVYTVGVEQGGPALDTVDYVVLMQEQFCQVGSVLACYAGDEGFFHGCYSKDFKAISGALDTIVSNAAAGPDGLRLCCSQF